MTRKIIVFGMLALAFAVQAEEWSPVQKKYIAHGWDLLAVTPEEVLANADAFDCTGTDGVTLMIKQKLRDGRTIAQSTIMNDPLWPREELKSKISVFREIVKHPSLKESFISSWWAPQKRLKWTDDAAWENFAANMGTVAWLAKQGGLRGILVDAEDYPRTEQYVRAPDDPPYDVVAKLARRRAARVFKAIFDEYPDVTFLSFWMLSLSENHFTSKDPMGVAREREDLWPWFVNGMLDVMPPTARFVDGNENAYHYRADMNDFYRSACRQRTAALGLVAPENRQKYLAQLRAGFGLYLDSYINPTNSPWYFEPVDGSRLAHFSRNLAQATDAADEFVWVYGEKRAWIPWKGTKSTQFLSTKIQECGTWNDALPGFDYEMGSVKMSFAHMRCRLNQLRKEGRAVNLAGAVKRPWPAWQHETQPRGKTGAEGETGVFLEGVSTACHLVHIRNVKPGELYAVTMKKKGDCGYSGVYWQKENRWQWQLPATIVVFSPAGDDGWCTGEVFTRVPDGADCLVLQLNAKKQKPGQRVVFDGVEIVKLSP